MEMKIAILLPRRLVVRRGFYIFRGGRKFLNIPLLSKTNLLRQSQAEVNAAGLPHGVESALRDLPRLTKINRTLCSISSPRLTHQIVTAVEVPEHLRIPANTTDGDNQQHLSP